MTMTIKLAPEMEQKLRQRSAALGLPASTLIREALATYFESTIPAQASAYSLGADLFGRHSGTTDLAETRKARLAQDWAEKHARRGR